jgi:hypothetical protein
MMMLVSLRRIALLSTLLAASTSCSHNSGTPVDGGVTIDDAPSIGAPRLIAPLSMATVTQQKPTFRWTLSAGSGTPVVELCKDRSCTMPLPITTQLAGDNLSAVPAAALPAGWVFWRVRVVLGPLEVSSATWQFWVGKSSASNPVDTSNGAILDVNGDGYPDFLVGALGAGSGMGAAHLYLGSATASVTGWNGPSTAQRIELTNPDGANASFGYSVASAGDVNGDGYADFLVGAYGADSNSGAAHLYLGSATPSPADWNGGAHTGRIDLVNLDGPSAIFGASVASTGDVNGDGYGDFVVGASKAGVVHLYLGSATPSATDLNGATPAGRIDLAGPAGFAAFGNAVASAGDVNGDGYADFVVGDGGANAAAGAAYLYLGSATPSAAAWNQAAPTARIDLTNPDGSNAAFGVSVTSAGDVNGDGYADFLIGALNAGSNAGAAHLYFGSATPSATAWNRPSLTARIDLINPDGAGALFGASVASAGDVNGDGYADFVVGAEGVSTGAGAAHLYLGAATPSAAVWNGAAPTKRLNLANPDGAGARFGASVASVGDVNGDGYADFLVGAHDAASGGAVQLYLGSAVPSATAWSGASSTVRMDLTNPDGASARFGVSLASAETIDADEHADFADHAIGSNAGVRRPERSARLRHALRRRAPLAFMRSLRSGIPMR